MKLLLIPLLAVFVSACSSTTLITPWSQSSAARAPTTESTIRATSAYQQCALREAEKMPSWNQSGRTAAEAALLAVDLCKTREQQLYDVVFEDSRGAQSPQSVADAYVKGIRERLINNVAMGFFQMRR